MLCMTEVIACLSDMLCMTKVIACLRAGVIAEYLSREKVWKDEV